MENKPDWGSVCAKVVKSIIHLPDRHFHFSLCCCASHPLCPSLFLLLLVSRTPCSGGPPPPASSSSAGTSGSNTADKHRVCVTCAGWDGINLRHFQKSLDGVAGHIVDSCWDSARVFERARVCVCVYMNATRWCSSPWLSHSLQQHSAPLLLGDGLGLGHSQCENLFLPLSLSLSLQPACSLPPSLPLTHSLSPLSFFLFISSWESRAHQLSLPSAARSLSLSLSLVNIKGMLVQPLASVSGSPSLARSLCLMLSFTPTSVSPPSSSLTFFLSVKAAFQMLISSQSKREMARGGMTETSGRFHHTHSDCNGWLLSCTNTQLQHKTAHPVVSHLFHKCIACCLYNIGSFQNLQS